MKKNVLQLIGSFHQGGSERQAVILTRHLHNEASFGVFAATLNREGVLRSEIEGIGLPAITEFPLTSFFNANFFRQVRRCSKYLTENRIDLLHTHDFYTNVFGMAAAKLAGIPACVASKRETGGMRSRGQEFVEKLAFNRADKVIVNSEAVREYLASWTIPEEKICKIYNGLNVQRFSRIAVDRSQFGLPTDEGLRFVTLIANLRHSVKNVPMLLRAAQSVIESRPNTHFVIAGEGELEIELRKLVAQLKIAKNTHFIGRCTDVPGLLSVSYVCVLTSTAEGFSNSILEYMAAGKPVVATNVGGASEAVVSDTTGYLTASNDDQALATHLIDLLSDEDKALKFGAAGKQVVDEKFSEKNQLRDTITLYNSLLKQI